MYAENQLGCSCKGSLENWEGLKLAGSGGMGGRTTGLRLVCRREQASSKETWMLDSRDGIDSE